MSSRVTRAVLSQHDQHRPLNEVGVLDEHLHHGLTAFGLGLLPTEQLNGLVEQGEYLAVGQRLVGHGRLLADADHR